MQESHSSNTFSETIAVIPSEKQRGMAVRCEVDENGNLIMATCLNVNRSLEITLLAAAACLFLQNNEEGLCVGISFCVGIGAGVVLIPTHFPHLIFLSHFWSDSVTLYS